ncbi:translation initiation factor IF-2 [Methanocella sp. CWC-04]|uniref:Probable translation initiation factor IF-2 n=1 Tax=Methanooceanicella nereidis TaxID=2052831 RepID=A0AAP2RFH3_9EURY|nr:translation initiation factor IF-2 [Methanocella sp. CWC-04]MCD1296363.1 translation initiation factor IF-2 [Methanocella sp. CWC-04]
MATVTRQIKDLRTPIICVMGHVDHGKTSMLDKIRGTTVTDIEAGEITQHIGATEVPLYTIESLCKGVLPGNIEVPGLLFIDTPGHHAFTTLRSRGGALSDLAVLVIDIIDGFQPQTDEALKILKQYKTPFIIAANKIDRIPGWRVNPSFSFTKTFESQPDNVKNALDNRIYDLAGKLSAYGFSADRYDRIRDFTRTIGIVPISARTGEGIPDLLMVLVGLAQKFLEKNLKLHVTGPGVGTVLEVKEDKGLGYSIDTIIYDGEIRTGDTIVIGGKEKPIVTKVRALLKPMPNRELRIVEKFDHVDRVTASAGVKILASDLDKAMAGSHLRVAREGMLNALIKEIESEIERAKIVTDETGIIVKADTIGSLEAIVSELRSLKIPIAQAEVGDISKKDIIEAETINDPLHRVVLGFNVKLLPDAKEHMLESDVRIFNRNVIYRLIDDYADWEETQKKLAEKKKMMEIVRPGRIKYLVNCTFRQSKPAVIGVQVQGGCIKPGNVLIKPDGSKVGVIKEIQERNENISFAKKGKEVAISLDGPVAGRQIHEGEVYYVDIPESHCKVLEFQLKDVLSQDELETLIEFLSIKRKDDHFWGK